MQMSDFSGENRTGGTRVDVPETSSSTADLFRPPRLYRLARGFLRARGLMSPARSAACPEVDDLPGALTDGSAVAAVDDALGDAGNRYQRRPTGRPGPDRRLRMDNTLLITTFGWHLAAFSGSRLVNRLETACLAVGTRTASKRTPRRCRPAGYRASFSFLGTDTEMSVDMMTELACTGTTTWACRANTGGEGIREVADTVGGSSASLVPILLRNDGALTCSRDQPYYHRSSLGNGEYEE